VTANRVRIIGGEHRSRLLRFPDRPGLRPTPDRVRETLFNWLGQDLAGLACLDLFAGSGALGFEAASRGAASVVMVERDRATFEALRTNAALLKLRAVELVRADALSFLATERRQFDVVFLDPPFDSPILAGVWPLLGAVTAPGSLVYVESPAGVDPGGPLRLHRADRAGNVTYQLFRHADE